MQLEYCLPQSIGYSLMACLLVPHQLGQRLHLLQLEVTLCCLDRLELAHRHCPESLKLVD